MAGYTLGFDDGGAMPDDQDDVTGSATPPAAAAPADDAGESYTPETDAAPAPAAQPSAELPDVGPAPGIVNELSNQSTGQMLGGAAQKMGSDIGEGVQNLKNDPMVKRIASYLMASDAADQRTAQKFEQGIKHENPGASDADANLLAIHKAHEMGGPAAAWAMLQYNRAGYNSSSAVATAALNGVEGKPPDAKRAADEATRASAFVPDGANIKFAPSADGNFTAAVKLPGTEAEQQYLLTPQQLQNVVSVGGEGQYDKTLQNGQPAILQKVGATPIQAGDKPAKGGKAPERPEDNDDLHATGGPNPNADQPTNFGKTPSTVDLSGRGGKQQENLNGNMDEPYSQRVRAQAYAEHPWASQGGARRADMQRLSQADEDRDAKVKAEQTKNEGAERRAGITADARRDVAGTQATSRETVAEGNNETSRANTGDRVTQSGKNNQTSNATKLAIAQGALQSRAAQAAQKAQGQNDRELIETYRKKAANELLANPGANADEVFAKNGFGPGGFKAPGSGTSTNTPTAAAPTKVAQPTAQQAPPVPGARQDPNTGIWWVKDATGKTVKAQ